MTKAEMRLKVAQALVFLQEAEDLQAEDETVCVCDCFDMVESILTEIIGDDDCTELFQKARLANTDESTRH